MISYRQADLSDRLIPKTHAQHEVVKLSDLVKGFDEGRMVKYVPNHAHGDLAHPDCEVGKISSWNSHIVFVNFGKGDTNQACDPGDLVWMWNYETQKREGDYEHTFGTLTYRMDVSGEPKWAVHPDGYKENINYFLSNIPDVPRHLLQEGRKIPIGFGPQDQFCRYES